MQNDQCPRQDEHGQDLAHTGDQFRFHKSGIVVLKQQAQSSLAYRTNDHTGWCTVTPFNLQAPWLRKTPELGLHPLPAAFGAARQSVGPRAKRRFQTCAAIIMASPCATGSGTSSRRTGPKATTARPTTSVRTIWATKSGTGGGPSTASRCATTSARPSTPSWTRPAP